ncbi:ABC transporter permease subunit [Plantibacter sp. PA-3-X8]|uniref:D-methionine transport system permease protein n=2 Tax=Plantibacter TaxID=190323 RepID=A0A3N2C6H7_9MICO|nr:MULTISPECIES: ABC transporter permease subunit [Plantibacter]AZH81750.1 ABC transporter permease subunit [Plantibacter sp. PA-3-X8]MBD8104472.1 ABC transporter permease subunit [Plantibacter sp. CFBP 8775]MBD8467897.1 ABC transporter permease subunit [Plantibacter sp. CFBP 8798]MBF4566081.1 ABC transporter permease subunit [Plantibacter sp. VKM Ac-2876]MDD9153504.1 ABC transporter permease subunit [Plantibacter flavus]
MRDFDPDAFFPRLLKAIGETGLMVSVSFAVATVIGILLGLLLYASRPGNLLQNRVVFGVLNFVINVIRPVPFLIVAIALIPLTRLVFGTGLGPLPATIPLILVASVAIGRVSESNLVAVSPGAIEAGAAMGASPVRVLFTIVVPEALGPLILGLTYILVALVDATAVAGVLGGGGLGDLAMTYGYQRFDWIVVGLVVVTLVLLVQLAQLLGNVLAKRVLHR